MTTAQDILYWRRWAFVSKLNHWRMERGRIAAHPAQNALVSTWHARVWDLAQQRALQYHRAVTADDLRHACHHLASGGWTSHADLDNHAFDQLLALWGNGRDLHHPLYLAGILADPNHLPSIDAFEHPERGTRRRLEWRARHAAPAPYRQAIQADQFPHDHLVADGLQPTRETLTTEHLHCQVRTLSRRTDRFARPISDTAGELPDPCPPSHEPDPSEYPHFEDCAPMS